MTDGVLQSDSLSSWPCTRTRIETVSRGESGANGHSMRTESRPSMTLVWELPARVISISALRCFQPGCSVWVFQLSRGLSTPTKVSSVRVSKRGRVTRTGPGMGSFSLAAVVIGSLHKFRSVFLKRGALHPTRTSEDDSPDCS
jgi:hypothetical protein